MEDDVFLPDNPAFARQRSAQSRQELTGVAPSTDNPALTRQQAIEARNRAVATEHESPVLGGVAGAYLGAGAGSTAAGYNLLKALPDLRNKTLEGARQFLVDAVKSATAGPHGGTNWTKSLTGADIPHAQMSKESLDKAKQMANVIAPGGELAGGQITKGGILLGPEMKAAIAAAEPTTSVIDKLAPYALKGLNLAGKYVAGPVLGGAAAGEQAMEGLNRYHEGDTTGAALSALGTAGDIGTVAGFPEFGIPVSLGARAINYTREHPEQFKEAMQQSSTLGMKNGGLAFVKKK